MVDMTLDYILPLSLIIFAHLIGDHVIQPFWRNGWLGENKYRNNRALGLHGLTYAAPLFVAVGINSLITGAAFTLGLLFLVINVLSHVGIDYVTSRLTHKHYESKDFRKFWTVIGADQALHWTVFVMTLSLLIP